MKGTAGENLKLKSLWFLGRLTRELATAVIPAVLIALFVNVHVAEAAKVQEGPSMQPNLYVGYRVMTEKVSYLFHEPRRGDIVVVDLPEEGIPLIKRVVGVAGEEVRVSSGHVWINGQAIHEPWVRYYGGRDYPATVIPEGHVFILGDNRGNSRDSRMIGPVPVKSIKGRAIFIYWPLEALEIIP